MNLSSLSVPKMFIIEYENFMLWAKVVTLKINLLFIKLDSRKN